MARNLSLHDLEDVDFQRREWVVERIAWVLIALFLVAAVLGVFGGGPLSHTTSADDEGTFEVEYERFIRSMGKAELTITLRPEAVRDGSATVFVSEDLLSKSHIDNIDPEPSSATSSHEGTIYEFGANAESPPVIAITYRSTLVGLTEWTIKAGEGDGARLWQLTYP